MCEWVHICVCVYACMYALCMHVFVVCVCVRVGEMCVLGFLCVHTQIYTAAKSICEYISKKNTQIAFIYIYLTVCIISLFLVCVCMCARARCDRIIKNSIKSQFSGHNNVSITMRTTVASTTKQLVHLLS